MYDNTKQTELYGMAQIKNTLKLKWPSQSVDQKPIENLLQDFETDVHQHSPSNLTEADLFANKK